jgi:hypothetical protein
MSRNADLSSDELRDLARLETQIDAAETEALETGWKLREIRDRRLWRGRSSSFSRYCRERFDMGPTSVRMRTRASYVFDVLTAERTPARMPKTISQAIALADGLGDHAGYCGNPFSPEEQKELRMAWDALAPKRGATLSAKALSDAVRKRRGLSPSTYGKTKSRYLYLGRDVSPDDLASTLVALYGPDWLASLAAALFRGQAMARAA